MNSFIRRYYRLKESLVVRIEQKTQLWRLHSIANKVGKNIKVYGNYDILNPSNFQIGDNCSINNDVYINAMCPVHIGNNVTLSAGSKIIAAGIDVNQWINGRKEHRNDLNIYIGDNVWIGANAMIFGGAKITGKYVVVAAGAVVTKDITESFCIVAGCPAKIIKKLK